MGRYITQAKAEAALTPNAVRRIFDDNRDGFADANPIAQAIDDAENEFDGGVRGIYDVPLLGALDPLVVTIVLAFFRAIAAERFARVLGQPWKPLRERAEAYITKLREHDLQLNHPLCAGAGVPDALSDDPRGYDFINNDGSAR